MSRRLLMLLAALCLIGTALAQFVSLPAAKRRAVYGLDYYVSPSAYDYAPAAQRIVGDATTQYERARRIYEWVCAHVEFDATTDVRTADEAWRTRRAVCQGYCELYYRLGEAVGLKTRLVYGKVKRPMRPGVLEDHVWLSVQTERGNILLDPTWGAGFSYCGRFIRLEDPNLWFDVEPEWLIFSHLPKSERRQQLPTVVTDEQFAALPYMTPLAAHIGIAPSDALAHLLAGGEPFPMVRMQTAGWPRQIGLLSVPRELHLHRGDSYTFVVAKLDDAISLSLTNGADAYAESQWKRESSTYTITVTPRHVGRLDLVIQSHNGVLVEQQKIVEYIVD